MAAYVSFILFGLILGLTPCALPVFLMMTTVSNLGSKDKSKSYSLSIIIMYIASLALLNALIGLAAAQLGWEFRVYLSNKFIIALFTLLFFSLGLSLLGLYRTRLPQRWLHKITIKKLSGLNNSYFEAMKMGMFTILIAAPCVAAPMFGLLVYIAYYADPAYGAISVMLTGVGFGLPLLSACLFGTDMIQQAGGWQHNITHYLGIILLGISLWLLTKLIAPHIAMYLWAAIFIFTAVYMGAFTAVNPSFAKDTHEVCDISGESLTSHDIKLKNKHVIIKAFSMMILLYGILVLLGAIMGNENPYSPLETTKVMLHESPGIASTAKSINLNQRRSML